MSYAFHDIKHIVQPYLDDLPAHSLHRADHLTHLRAIFMRCRHYQIRMNPHKCVFCIETGHLLGFVVSEAGIRVDPSKVEAIVKLPPPSTLRQLQSLGKYSKWIVILQEFDLEFEKSKSKKSLVLAELMCDFPHTDTETVVEEPIADESLFLISTLDPWYGDIIVYLQTQSFRPEISQSQRRKIRFQSQPYNIIGDTLYRRGVDSVFCHCLIHEEVEKVLNDCHSGACGSHMSGYAITQKILRTGYFWPSLFKDCIDAVRKCHNCQIFYRKMCAPPTPLHPIIVVGPFAKWDIDFITCNPHSVGGHEHIILAVDYFTKWAEAMPTFSADGKTAAIFVFNHIIARFSVPQVIITDHGSHLRNIMMIELTDQLGLCHNSSTRYYPQANGLVEAISKVLVTMIRRIIGIHRSNWYNMLFSVLRAYRTSVKTSTGFIPFQLVYGLEAVLPIECKIPSLQIAIELLPATSKEEINLLYLAQLDENRRDAALAIETHEKRIKAQYDRNVTPRNFSEGDLVLLYDQANDKLGAGKFVPMWHGPFVVKRKLAKGAYELVDFDSVSLDRPKNQLYLKRYYA
eukprot:PITA_14159